ncbi:hypothetical protein ACMDCO_09130, partial [Aerococcus urinaeequi]
SLSEKIKKDDPDSLSGSSFVGSVTLFFYLFSLTVGFHTSFSFNLLSFNLKTFYLKFIIALWNIFSINYELSWENLY